MIIRTHIFVICLEKIGLDNQLNFSFYPIGFYFWLVSGIYLFGEYVVHNYRTCTLNVELQNKKIQFGFIPYKLKYLLVNKVKEIKVCLS